MLGREYTKEETSKVLIRLHSLLQKKTLIPDQYIPLLITAKMYAEDGHIEFADKQIKVVEDAIK